MDGRMNREATRDLPFINPFHFSPNKDKRGPMRKGQHYCWWKIIPYRIFGFEITSLGKIKFTNLFSTQMISHVRRQLCWTSCPSQVMNFLWNACCKTLEMGYQLVKYQMLYMPLSFLLLAGPRISSSHFSDRLLSFVACRL
jgi:hypothetical protein